MVSIAAHEIAEYRLIPRTYTGVSLVLILLATVSVCLRVYVRGFMIRTFGTDDWLLLVAYAIFVGNCSLFIAMGVLELQRGLTGPVDILSTYQVIGMLIYFIDQIFLKFSIAFFFGRILQEKWQKWVLYTTMVVYCLYEFAAAVIAIFECGVPGGSAELLIGYNPNCLSWAHAWGPVNYSAAALNAVTDWLFIFLPIFQISTATLTPIRTKLSACLPISLGALGSIASIARIPLIDELNGYGLIYFSQLQPLILVSLTETGIGIIAISLATLRPLVDRCLERISRAGSEASSYKSNMVELPSTQHRRHNHSNNNSEGQDFHNDVQESSIYKANKPSRASLGMSWYETTRSSREGPARSELSHARDHGGMNS